MFCDAGFHLLDRREVCDAGDSICLTRKKVCDAGHFKCLTREVGNAGDFACLTVALWCGRFYMLHL